jgi:hypothetical protein
MDHIAPTHHDNLLEISTIRTIKEAEEIRDIWEEMHPHPYSDIDYYLTVLNSRQEVVRPHVILLSRKGSPETILVGRIEIMQFEYKIGRRVLFRSAGRSLMIVEGGILGNTSYNNCAVLASELIHSLKRDEADCVFFKETPIDYQIYKLANKKSGLLFRDHLQEIDLHYKMTLPASIDEFFNVRSSKKRTKLRSLLKRLERRYPGKVAVRCIRETGKVEQFCRGADEISRETYQHAYGEGFADNFETRYFLNLLAERGWLRIYTLYVEDRLCAYWAGFIYNHTHYGLDRGGTGYDHQYRKFEVGTILMLKMIEDLCNDIQVQYLDFGYMDAAYKSRFCDIYWKEANFYIFQPSLKGIKLNAIRTLSRASYLFKNMLLKRLRLKNKWIKLEA